jgi:reversibly glycosylated polypeptide/UDP-arabinopyranose mutase
MSKIAVVVPTIRPESYESFREAWAPLFKKHNVDIFTVWDGEHPRIDVEMHGGAFYSWSNVLDREKFRDNTDLFCRRTDACRNLGFVAAAQLNPDYLLTLDDDCHPILEYPSKWEGISSIFTDPIQAHIDALQKRVPITWMNTAHESSEYLRGVPYSVREEAPVMLSHGVWVGTPDFDGETQLRLENTGKLPYSMPYYVGPVPRGVLFPLCGMSIMVRREAIPYLYYAPQGADSGYPDVHRFGDIWMGVLLKREFDMIGWAIYTGASMTLHSRASDARKNFEQEKVGRKWNEWVTNRQYSVASEEIEEFGRFQHYWQSHIEKRARFNQLITGILQEGK